MIVTSHINDIQNLAIHNVTYNVSVLRELNIVVLHHEFGGYRIPFVLAADNAPNGLLCWLPVVE